MVSSQIGPDGLRDCFRDPIPEIFEAATLLDRAVSAHHAGRFSEAEELLVAADMERIGDWTSSIWFTPQKNKVPGIEAKIGTAPIVPESQRHQLRDATQPMKRALVARDGFHCQFCAIPLVRVEVRKALSQIYPIAVRWDQNNKPRMQHFALEAMWLQYDHVEPHARGGMTTMENILVTCAVCNYGRERFTLGQVAFRDPRLTARKPTWSGWQDWDGLERLLPEPKRIAGPRNLSAKQG